MSKKINIVVPNKVKPNLVNLFHNYLSRKAKESSYDNSWFDDYEDMESYWNEVFPGWDIDDDVDVVFPPKDVLLKKSNNGKKGKCKHSKGKKSKYADDVVHYTRNARETYDFYDDNGISTKEIWFYPDYHDKDDKLEFNTLKEFSDYCESMGYFLDPSVEEDIEWRYESHCCLNPDSMKSGLLEIMTAHSYGEMFYEACEEYELNY